MLKYAGKEVTFFFTLFMITSRYAATAVVITATACSPRQVVLCCYGPCTASSCAGLHYPLSLLLNFTLTKKNICFTLHRHVPTFRCVQTRLINFLAKGAEKFFKLFSSCLSIRSSFRLAYQKIWKTTTFCIKYFI